MATPTLDELFTQLTKDQIVASALSVAGTVELPVTAWVSGSVGREVIEIICYLMSTYASGASTSSAAAGMLDYARGDWLYLTGAECYDTEIVEATFGTCDILLQNVAGVPYPINEGDLRFYAPRTGATYTNTESGILPAGGSHTLAILAEQAGSSSNAAIGEITELVTPLAGVTCTNTTPCVGTDIESRANYIARCRAEATSKSPNGPSTAYDYFARSTVRGDGTNAGITRTYPYQTPSMPGILILYLASDAGVVAPSDVALVQANLLENCVPLGITCTAVSAVERDVYFSANVYLRPGSSGTAAGIQTDIMAALTEFFRELPIGGTVLNAGTQGYCYDEAISACIFSASDQIVQVTITSGGDVPLAQNEVAVLTSVGTDFNVVQT